MEGLIFGFLWYLQLKYQKLKTENLTMCQPATKRIVLAFLNVKIKFLNERNCSQERSDQVLLQNRLLQVVNEL